MTFSKRELKLIHNNKKMLSNKYSHLLKQINKKSSVDKLNRVMSAAQYVTKYYNDILNMDIYGPHIRSVKVTHNKHWFEDNNNVEVQYHFNWSEDFIENGKADWDSCDDGIRTKAQVLKDMHSWRNPYGGEWEYASDNYPNIRVDLPNAIEFVNKDPHYWLECFNRDDNDYRVKDLTFSTVNDFLESMLSLFQDKETTIDADF